MTPALSCNNLSIAFEKHQVLDGFSLSVRQGSVHALLGRNGAGKSTTFRIMLGLTQPDEGSVSIFGKPNTPENVAKIGASVNDAAVYPHLSARDNLRVHAALMGFDDKDIDHALRMVDLEGTGNKKAKAFSTGMKARLALATAILGHPPILLLDEPHNGLDPQGITRLRTFLKQWADQGGTVIVSSHQLGEMTLLAEDVTILADGHTAYTGPLSRLAAPGQLENRFLELTGGEH